MQCNIKDSEDNMTDKSSQGILLRHQSSDRETRARRLSTQLPQIQEIKENEGEGIVDNEVERVGSRTVRRKSIDQSQKQAQARGSIGQTSALLSQSEMNNIRSKYGIRLIENDKLRMRDIYFPMFMLLVIMFIMKCIMF